MRVARTTGQGTSGSVSLLLAAELGAEPADVGGGVRRLADDRRARGPDDGDKQRGIDRARLEVGVPVPARAELVAWVVAMHQVNPAGDRLYPGDDAGGGLPTGGGGACVEAET